MKKEKKRFVAVIQTGPPKNLTDDTGFVVGEDTPTIDAWTWAFSKDQAYLNFVRKYGIDLQKQYTDPNYWPRVEDVKEAPRAPIG